MLYVWVVGPDSGKCSKGHFSFSRRFTVTENRLLHVEANVIMVMTPNFGVDAQYGNEITGYLPSQLTVTFLGSCTGC